MRELNLKIAVGIQDSTAKAPYFSTKCSQLRLNLKNAVENHFTAKQQRAQRTYIKNKTHLFGEVLDHTKLNSKPCLSFVSLRLCVGNLNSYCRV
jgi:hypothetical protein